MRVIIPTPLRSYTGGKPEIESRGKDLRSVIDALEASCPGIRFRVIDEQVQIRTHIKFFVAGELAEDLGAVVGERQDVQIICALSGG